MLAALKATAYLFLERPYCIVIVHCCFFIIEALFKNVEKFSFKQSDDSEDDWHIIVVKEKLQLLLSGWVAGFNKIRCSRA